MNFREFLKENTSVPAKTGQTDHEHIHNLIHHVANLHRQTPSIKDPEQKRKHQENIKYHTQLMSQAIQKKRQNNPNYIP
jgi:hypothetical protein